MLVDGLFPGHVVVKKAAVVNLCGGEKNNENLSALAARNLIILVIVSILIQLCAQRCGAEETGVRYPGHQYWKWGGGGNTKN